MLVKKSLRALQETRLSRLVVAGGVGANTRLREQLNAAAARRGLRVHYPELALCTDNGAMIALAGAMRLQGDPSLAQRGLRVRRQAALAAGAGLKHARKKSLAPCGAKDSAAAQSVGAPPPRPGRLTGCPAVRGTQLTESASPPGRA